MQTLTDEQILALADTQVPSHLHGLGNIGTRDSGAVEVRYMHYGPGGRQRVTVVIINVDDGTIIDVITN